MNIFNKYEEDILILINTEAGRYLCGIKESYPIIKVSPNSYHLKTGDKIQAHFFCYEKIAKIFLPIITKMEIAEEKSYRAFLHFSNLEEQRTIYPQIYLNSTDFFSGSGDGEVQNSNATWSTGHDAATGTFASTAATTPSCYTTIVTGTYNISRSFIPFDTSSLQDAAIISAATLKLNVATVNQSVGTSSFALVQTSQASPTALATTDFGSCGSASSPTEGATRLVISTTGSKTFTLNATGLTWISLTSYTLLGMRTGWLDCDNVAPTDNVQEVSISWSASETSGTTNDPTLTVIYTIPSAGFFAII